ncbi:ubiquitin-protein ligase isoform X2 [Wolffia australiana]
MEPEEDDSVVLVLTASDGEEEDVEMTLSTSEIDDWDLSRVLRFAAVRVRTSRSRLVERSSYFRGLFGGCFSESASCQTCIRCDIKTAISVLRCIFGYQVDIGPENYLHLLKAALFFGVDDLLSECKAWLKRATSTNPVDGPQISLENMIEIWSYSSEHGVRFVSEMCCAYLARNFMWTLTLSSFADIPYGFLCSCLEHPDLTVHSEKELCEAVVDWIESNRNLSESSSDSEGDDINILKKVRTFLLPVGFLASKSKNRWFSSIARGSIQYILYIIKESHSKRLGSIKFSDYDNFMLRITQHSKKIDLSSCVHLTDEILCLMLFPSEMEKASKEGLMLGLGDHIQRSRNSLGVLEKLLSKRTFESVLEFDLSKCWNLKSDTLISILGCSFPALQVLNLAYCSRFKVEDFFSLVQKCASLTNVDMTVDVSPIIPTLTSISSSSSDQYQSSSGIPYSAGQHLPAMCNIAKLTLAGRTDLKDQDLVKISALSSTLCHLNIKGCIALTDVGISKLLEECLCLQSVIVSYTYFGMNSVVVLCEKEFPNRTIESFHSHEKSFTIAFRLQELQMDGCHGIEARHMKQLMKCLYMLSSLSLCKTSLSDDALSEYRGTSLERLDISETQVSLCGLQHIMKRNPGIKALKASGCRNFHNDVGISSKPRGALAGVKSISFGLGASVDISRLPDIFPLLETLVLRFQVVSDTDMRTILKSLTHLHVLDLRCCHCDLTLGSFQFGMRNLKSLRLERATPWMTDTDLPIISTNCSNLTQLSLSGCKLLTSDAQRIISSGWPGLTFLHLEDCGTITSNGVSSLLDCVALEDLCLRHNGRGIKRDMIIVAASKLPLLRKLALDLCDACEGGFDSPNHKERFSLCILKIARCRLNRSAFDQGKRPVHRDTVVQVWSSTELWTASLEQRL